MRMARPRTCSPATNGVERLRGWQNGRDAPARQPWRASAHCGIAHRSRDSLRRCPARFHRSPPALADAAQVSTNRGAHQLDQHSGAFSPPGMLRSRHDPNVAADAPIDTMWRPQQCCWTRTYLIRVLVAPCTICPCHPGPRGEGTTKPAGDATIASFQSTLIKS